MSSQDIDIEDLKKVVTENLSGNKTQSDRNWRDSKEDLIRLSLQGNSVLVIGSESILDKKKYSYVGGDSETFLLNCLKTNKQTSKRYQNFNSFAEVTDEPQLMKDLDNLFKENEDTWEENVMDMIEPSLLLLLKSKLFRLVITTAFDPFLEYALKRIWNGRLDVVNFLKDFNLTTNNEETDIKSTKQSEFYEINPTLFYAFGKMINRESVIAITDDIKIYTIHCWLGHRKPNKLLNYIQNKRIIAFGCDFENWVIKFLWYLLIQSNNPNNSFNIIDSMTKGSVAVNFSFGEEDKTKTTDFLGGKHFIFFEDSREFAGLLGIEIMNKLNNVPDMGPFFISYAHENYDIANKIYTSLVHGKQNVWFDKRKLIIGDFFDERIQNGIKQCIHFIPILSNTVINDLKNNNRDRYYLQEWEQAQIQFNNQNKEEPFIVLPIVTEEFEREFNMIKTDYEKNNVPMPIPSCITKEHFFSIKEHGFTCQLLEEINAKIQAIIREAKDPRLEAKLNNTMLQV